MWLAAGDEAGRDAILGAGLARLLPGLLAQSCEDAQEAAVWCCINLTASGPEHPGAAKRVAALREAGALFFPWRALSFPLARAILSPGARLWQPRLVRRKTPVRRAKFSPCHCSLRLMSLCDSHAKMLRMPA